MRHPAGFGCTTSSDGQWPLSIRAGCGLPSLHLPRRIWDCAAQVFADAAATPLDLLCTKWKKRGSPFTACGPARKTRPQRKKENRFRTSAGDFVRQLRSTAYMTEQRYLKKVPLMNSARLYEQTKKLENQGFLLPFSPGPSRDDSRSRLTVASFSAPAELG